MGESDVTASVSANSFLGRFAENIRAGGNTPAKTLIGFFAAWAAYFYIVWVMPLPEGMSAAGKSTLAVLVWATTMWITEALPVGITGLIIPMLLVMGERPPNFRRLQAALPRL